MKEGLGVEGVLLPDLVGCSGLWYDVTNVPFANGMGGITFPLKQIGSGAEVTDMLRVAVAVEANIERVPPCHRGSPRRATDLEGMKRTQEYTLLEKQVQARGSRLSAIKMAEIVPAEV
jgi:hypothetical protein